MKIKHHGKIPNWELEVTCKHCNAVIILEGPDDLHVQKHATGNTSFASRFDGPDTYHYVCPDCETTNSVPYADVKEIKDEIKLIFC